MSVNRIDQGPELGRPVRLANGWLRVDGRLTRTGIFLYRKADGSIRRELRTDAEVFAPEAINSFGLVPVTDEHPPAFLDASNTKDHARGSIGESPRRDGKFIAAPLLVTDAELIAKLEDGTARELSCGYTCDLEETPGVTPDGHRYDAIQRNIRGNHVAIVPRGRAGPEARVRMDGADLPVLRIETETEDGDDATRGAPHNHKERHVKKTIKIDGVSYEVEAEGDAVVQAFAKNEQRHADELAALKAKIDAADGEKAKLQAKIDAQAEELKAKAAELEALPAKLQAKAKARADLETKAARVLGPKFAMDKLDDKAIRSAVLAKLVPEFKAEGRADAYLEARFDAELERFDADGDHAAKVRADLEGEGTRNDRETVDADEARRNMIKANRDAWKPKTTAA